MHKGYSVPKGVQVSGIGDGGRKHEEDVDEGGHGEAEHESEAI